MLAFFLFFGMAALVCFAASVQEWVNKADYVRSISFATIGMLFGSPILIVLYLWFFAGY